MESKSTMVLNSNNKSSVITPKMQVLKNTMLTPNKFTFLKSNQLTTRYIKKGNVISNLQQNNSALHSKSMIALNAYDNSYFEIDNNEQKLKQKQSAILQTLCQAKQTLANFHKQKVSKNKVIESQVKKIELMAETMFLKAADIMYGRNNSTYCRRQIEIDEMPLKQMKNTTCERSLKKVEATRKLMITKSKKMLQKLPYSSMKCISASVLSDSFTQCEGNSSIMTSSILSQQKKSKQNKLKSETYYKKQLQKNCFQHVIAAQRRNAANQAFGLCWQLGNTDKKVKKTNLFQNIQKTTKKPVRADVKRSERESCFMDRIKQGEKCEMIVNKKYSNAFESAVKDFVITDQQKAQ